MTRIRQVRWAIALVVAGAALLAMPGVAAAASLTLTAPGSIYHKKTYRVTASGSVGKAAYVIVVYQHRPCSNRYPGNQDANSKTADGGSVIFKKVGSGLFDTHTVKLKGGSKGSVIYCGYLYGAKQSLDSKPLARASHKTIFT